MKIDRDELKRAEGRGYAKGYAAGRRRLETEIDAELRHERERQRHDAYFCAALTGVLQNGGWRTGDKPWSNIQEYVAGAMKFADEAMKQARFTR